MIKNIFLSVIFFIFSQIKYAKEDKIIEKNDSKNLNESENLQIKPFLIDDYCNVGQSQIVTRFFTEVYEYFNSSVIYPDKCLILDNIFNKYSTQFEYISEYNHESFLYFTCPFCHKDFKSSPLLNLHYKLFHMKINESLICPGDFCMSINCNKYYDYFTIKKFSKEPGDVKFNRQPIEKDENCVEELIFFYQNNCMKLIEGCFGNDLEKYFKYYKYICKEIKCKNSNDAQITKESEVGDIFRYIFMYIVGILCAIYLLILWINKLT